MQASMAVDGCNKYIIPHLRKEQLENCNGLLPQHLACHGSIFTEAREFVQSIDTDINNSRTK
ncbi:TPA: hypothetical protein N0F65_008036 [Lagenidium giganteum]|uniref:Uncharacterized protein n=1 Tax=Lagenidium giganteum TaxID=4803 RepID=A0AAV2YJX4_9STRA|nr:TPA: hypothetical protein N0F65_008036 [Lagenidium giganteum]